MEEAACTTRERHGDWASEHAELRGQDDVNVLARRNAELEAIVEELKQVEQDRLGQIMRLKIASLHGVRESRVSQHGRLRSRAPSLSEPEPEGQPDALQAVIDEMKTKEERYLWQITELTKQLESESRSYEHRLTEVEEQQERHALQNRRLEEEVSEQRQAEQHLLSEISRMNQSAFQETAEQAGRAEWLKAVANAHEDLASNLEVRLSEMELETSEKNHAEQASASQLKHELQALRAIPRFAAQEREGIAEEESCLFEALKGLKQLRSPVLSGKDLSGRRI